MAAAPVTVPLVTLGSQGLEVSAQGLGCMGMSFGYGPPKPDPDMIALIHHAVAAGVTFLDTSDIYGPHTNEILLGKALQGGVRGKVQLATKFGASFVDGKFELRGDPAYVRAACEGSLKRLGVDCVDLYYQHRVDKGVPIEVTVGELKKLVEEGKIKYIGLSEASASTIRRAHAVHPITAIQLEWSLWSRDVEEDIIPTCRELGIGIVAYSPLGRGFFSSGAKLIDSISEHDYRKTLPRFQPESLEKNVEIFKRVNAMATRKGCTPSQLALAWVHHQGSDVCPIPGTTKIENFDQNVGALSVKLTPDEMAELESYAAAGDVQGDRYSETAYTWKDSETPPLSSWKSISEHDRKNLPRFQPENLEKNVEIFKLVNEMATRKGCTPSQLALGSDVCPIPGTTKIENFDQNVGALSVNLTPDEMAEVESYAAAGDVQGDRYSETANALKDSETPPLSSCKSE